MNTLNDPAVRGTMVEAAKTLARLADELRGWLSEHEAPRRHVRCSELLLEGAVALDQQLAGVDQPEADAADGWMPLQPSEAHDFRNHLNVVFQSLQRLANLDSAQAPAALESRLAEIRALYEQLADAPMSCDPEADSVKARPDSDAAKSSGMALAASVDSGVMRLLQRGEESGRILIVDDDWKACELLEESLEEHGHIATSCRRPERVVELLREGAFDVCLLDVNMPRMSGWDLLAQIKSDSRTSHTSVIVVSGVDRDESATLAIRSGADDFISKPVNVSLLAARIANCLSLSRQHLHELTKFLPRSVVDVIRKEPHRLQRGHEATVTVMFCDIRRFSRISEHMSPSETIRWISDVMENLSNRILEDGGTLVDFVGDEVFAMWGAPQPTGDHAELACRCALRIQETVRDLNHRWSQILGDQMEVGIGIHSGIVSVGNTGSPQRFKYGPLGNTVNLGSRVQGATKHLRSNILITRATRRQIARDMVARRLCSVRVNNIERPVDLFELVTDSTQAMKDRDAAYEEALASFESGQFMHAVQKLGGMLVNHPDDGPSLLLMNRLIEAKLNGDAEFNPIWTLPGK